MSTPSLRAYEPKAQPEPFCGYDKRVEAYGKPPTGYRWLKVGEKMPAESIYANHHEKKWIRGSCIGHVADSNYAFAAPITPELIPADPSAAVALEVVNRTTRKVEFKIARQEGVPRREDFIARDGLRIVSIYNPAVDFTRHSPKGTLFLRGNGPEHDHKIVSCTPKRFERIVAALAEYNASLAPKSPVGDYIAELKAEIASLKAKVAEQEKSLAKIKEIVA